MRFGDFPLADCEGGVLAHSLRLDSLTLAKGRVLTPGDIERLSRAGQTSATVALPDPDDVSENTAAARLAAMLCGSGLSADPPAHGRVNLRAEEDGLFLADVDAIARFNMVSETITLGTMRPHACVRSGDIVATLKVIPFFVAASDVSAADAIGATLRLAQYLTLTVTLIQTRLPGTADKMLAKTERVTRARITRLGGGLMTSTQCAHETTALATAIRRQSADLILVAGASATSDRRDVIPAAIVAAGGDITRLGMPVDPGNLLLLGQVGSVPVIGLPGCARSPKRNGLDFVLERLFAGLDVSDADIAVMGIGGLLADAPRPDPRPARVAPPVRKVGALILAAGRATRMGANKLHEDLAGQPLLTRTVAAASALPRLVVTGHQAERTRALLPEGIVTIHAEDHADGLSASLGAGIVAIPPDWDAALIMLGDMPLIEPELIAAMTGAAKTQDDIVIPTFEGRRGNPVLWGRRHFPALAALEGDMGGKPVLAANPKHVREVGAPSASIFMDADTPAALDAVRAAFNPAK
ncbi:MAG: molybdopterin-binding/glycosyltransferase family 2 protein [Pacificimonas sp.]